MGGWRGRTRTDHGLDWYWHECLARRQPRGIPTASIKPCTTHFNFNNEGEKVMNNTGSVLLMFFTIILLGVVTLGMWGCPKYEVYSQEMTGKAELARADQNRQILVTQAQAEKEAAIMRAEAIAIVGAKAKEFPEYRTQEFIGAFAEAMKDGKISQIIYVPTEANIPIAEARNPTTSTNAK